MRTNTLRLETPAVYGTLAAVETPARNAGRAAGRALGFVAAPLAGLAFVIAGPFIGLGALAWVALKALFKRYPAIARFARNAGLFVAAPFIGLAYALALPFVGIGMLVWVAFGGRHA